MAFNHKRADFLTFKFWIYVSLFSLLNQIDIAQTNLINLTSSSVPSRGGHFRINLYGTCRFSGYHFSA